MLNLLEHSAGELPENALVLAKIRDRLSPLADELAACKPDDFRKVGDETIKVFRP